MTFLQWFGLVALGMWAVTVLAYRSAQHGPADNFGAGALVLVAGTIAGAMTIAWMVVAATKTSEG